MSDGLFLECCNEVAKKYPSIQYESMLLDQACLKVYYSYYYSAIWLIDAITNSNPMPHRNYSSFTAVIN
jgi:hypothetical protein